MSESVTDRGRWQRAQRDGIHRTRIDALSFIAESESGNTHYIVDVQEAYDA